jgi:excisionase family DNA binding protein
MQLEGLISVEDAARRLRISRRAVTELAASGRLEARKLGHAWWLDVRSVERRGREDPAGGRPLSPAMAWSVLLLASGLPSSPLLAHHAHHQSRAKRWLAQHRLADHAGRLRGRARRESLAAHPSELGRLLARDDVVPTGISAARSVGLHGGEATIEFYAQESHRHRICDAHALQRGDGPVLIRWVADEIWPAIAGETAPRAAVLVDLLENDHPRARREAARELAR